MSLWIFGRMMIPEEGNPLVKGVLVCILCVTQRLKILFHKIEMGSDSQNLHSASLFSLHFPSLLASTTTVVSYSISLLLTKKKIWYQWDRTYSMRIVRRLKPDKFYATSETTWPTISVWRMYCCIVESTLL